ncbi:MAG: hypothetical protein OCU22_10145 [Canidatus Methanoxibalbensis ujae]|nr:hypothetical protein [Candidatus Methanoxibalbensis ujae]
MIWCNVTLSEQERPWTACNGATRQRLIVVNTTGKKLKSPFSARIGYLTKGKCSYIFINEGQTQKDLVIWLNSGYGYDVFDKTGQAVKPIFEDYSVGGYGNSQSQFGIYELKDEIYIKEYTYKNRKPPEWFKVSKEGIKRVEPYQIPFISKEIIII